MGPNRLIDSAYGDDRRNYSSRADSYKQDDRDGPLPYRRDSREYRDRRYSSDVRDVRSPLESRYGYPEGIRSHEPSFNPPSGPRKPSTSVKSPASASDNLGDELRFKRMPSTKSITTSLISNPATAMIPKAKDPRLQEAFKVAYNWGEKSNERLLLLMRKNKLAQEANQRRYESGKLAAKAPAYPPYHGLADKFAPTDSNLDQQIKLIEDDYLRELEQLIARFTTSARSAGTNDRDQVNTDLEAKVERFSQLASKQTEQIQALLTDSAKTRETITSLETAFKSMESDHNLVNQKYSSLKSEHDSLRSEFRTSQSIIQSLQSKQQNIDKENKSLKKQLQNFQSSTEMKLGSSEAQLTELVQKSSNAGESTTGVDMSLEQRIAGIETKLAAFPDYDDIKEKLDDLDLATFNEMCEAWVSEDYNLKTQYEEYSQRRRQKASSVDDVSPVSNQAIENIVDIKVAAARESITNEFRNYCEQRDDMHGEIIDEAVTQIRTLEEKMFASQSELANRVRFLEERKIPGPGRVEQTQNLDIAARVACLENKTIDARVDRIDLDVGELSRKSDALISEVGQLARRDWVELRLQELLSSVGMNTAFVGDIKDLQRKIPSMELAIKSLDAQFQNLSTKQLADQIVRLVTPGLEQRFTTLEFKTNHLENKANDSEKALNLQAKRLHETSELLYTITPSGKRVASPTSHLDEPNKKRKLDVNGGQHSPVQQVQQQQQQPQPQLQPQQHSNRDQGALP